MLPIRVLKENAQQERGETVSFFEESILFSYLWSLFIFFLFQARLSSFVGATAIGDLVKSTLGPRGMVCFQLIEVVV
jgi:hypothetical protein